MSEMKFVFWDVQHGHATYVKSPNDRHVVVDLGTGSYKNDAEFSPLRHLRTVYRIARIDHVIITHPHVDHIDDIFEFDNSNPKILTRPSHLEKDPIIRKATEAEKPKILKYFEIDSRYSASLGPYDNSDSSNWGGMTYNSYVAKTPSQSNINNHSMVTIFEYEGLKVLIPGDNEPPSWNELKENAWFMSQAKDIDVLLAPHHGRESGYDNEMMRHFNPRITVISDGPFMDSSATSKYSSVSRGWDVHKSNGTQEKRYCVTTRKDGVITASLGINAGGGKYIAIGIN